jgi:glucan phosphorylase
MPGGRLRLKQQHFFVSCSLQDMLRNLQTARPADAPSSEQHWAVQLNDTHPAIAVAELMRLLVDEHQLDWDQAWGITSRSLAYTNHTLLPEALECWGLDLFGALLPRHLEIIFELNARFLQAGEDAAYPGDDARAAPGVDRSTSEGQQGRAHGHTWRPLGPIASMVSPPCTATWCNGICSSALWPENFYYSNT